MRSEVNGIAVTQAGPPLPSTRVPEPNAEAGGKPSPPVPAGPSRVLQGSPGETSRAASAASAAHSPARLTRPREGGARGDQSRDRRTSGGRRQRGLALTLEQRRQLLDGSAAEGSGEM